jgi:hypothetical protein
VQLVQASTSRLAMTILISAAEPSTSARFVNLPF